MNSLGDIDLCLSFMTQQQKKSQTNIEFFSLSVLSKTQATFKCPVFVFPWKTDCTNNRYQEIFLTFQAQMVRFLHSSVNEGFMDKQISTESLWADKQGP